MLKRLATIVFGNRVFQTPVQPYAGEDSVLRLGPIDYRQFLSDLAGGGHIAGYSVWQGAPSRIANMPQPATIAGGGEIAGYGAQPGPLMDLAASAKPQNASES